MRERATISSVVPILVAREAARVSGVPLSGLLAGSGLEGSGDPRPDQHVGVDTYVEVWRRALALVQDPAFPLRLAGALQLEDSELFGFLAMSCETLAEAYEKSVKYRALFAVGSDWELGESDRETRVVWRPWRGALTDRAYCAAMEFAMLDMINAIARLGRSAPRPSAVRLVHRAPPASFYVEHFGVEPAFGSAQYELVYPAGLGRLPIATFNSKLRNYFDEECRKLITSMGSSTKTSDQVRGVLIRAMSGGDSSVEVTARALGLSTRSLQRRLTEEGTRYNDVLSDVRAEFAKRYLAQGSVSASEVALLLGFSEPGAFFKAFRRWTGMTPRAFQLRSRAST